MFASERGDPPASTHGEPANPLPLVLATATDDYPVDMDALCLGLDGAAVARAVPLPRCPMSTEQEEESAVALADASGILVRVGYLGPRLVALLPRLRVVTLHGTGVDQVDLPACLSRGIVVTNVPAANAGAVAELTLGLILSLLRRIPRADAALRAGDWAWGRSPAEELAGKTVGIVGYGNIGQRVAGLVRAFGASVIVHTRSAIVGQRCMPLDDLLAASDIVSLHVPLTKYTVGMLNTRRIGQMKAGAILINTARGGLVDEGALAVALESGRLAGAGLDVFSLEPPDQTNRLLALSNVIVTPHMGSSSRQALAAIAHIAGQDMARVLRRLPPLHPISAES